MVDQMDDHDPDLARFTNDAASDGEAEDPLFQPAGWGVVYQCACVYTFNTYILYIYLCKKRCAYVYIQDIYPFHRGLQDDVVDGTAQDDMVCLNCICCC